MAEKIPSIMPTATPTPTAEPSKNTRPKASYGTPPASAKPSAKPSVTPVPEPTDPANPDAVVDPRTKMLSDFKIYVDNQGNEYITGANTSSEYFFVVQNDGHVQPYADINQAREGLVKQLGTNYNSFIRALDSAGFVSATDKANQDYIPAIDDFIRAYSVREYQNLQKNKNYNFVAPSSIVSYVKTVASAGAKSKVRVTTAISTRPETDRAINQYMLDTVGRVATPEERSEYFNTVNSAERKATVTSTTSGTIGSGLSSADYAVMQAQVAKKALAGSQVDSLLNSKTPGAVVNDIKKLQSVAADYGVTMSAAEAMKYVAAGLGQSNYLVNQENRIKQISKTLYPTLAAHIDGGGTVKDIADQYAQAYSRKLGVEIPESTKNADVMAAVTHPNGPVNINDFNRQLQANPLWRKTPEAHQAVTDFANTILSSFGFGG